MVLAGCEPIKEQMFFITVIQMLNRSSFRKRAVHRFRIAFFGSFLAKQKRTNKNAEE